MDSEKIANYSDILRAENKENTNLRNESVLSAKGIKILACFANMNTNKNVTYTLLILTPSLNTNCLDEKMAVLTI